MTPIGQSLSLVGLSILNPPPGNWLMGVLKGYLDESGTEEDLQHRACTVAGYVGPEESWTMLERRWDEALHRHGVPYLHMKEFAHSKPPFEKFKHNEDARRAFLADLIEIIRDARLYGVGCTIRIVDLQRFNRENGQHINAYELGIYACLLELDYTYKGEPIELILDRQQKHAGKIATVRAYAATDTYYPHCGESIQILPPEGCLSFKEVPAIQVADFAAWELRKSNENMNEWFENIKSGDDTHAWFASLIKWTLETKERFPAERRSCSALLSASPIEGIVFDFRALCIADDARGHIWP